MKIGDLAAKTGLSVHTIRYYEKIGLMPDAHRDAGGRRQYGLEITNWLTFLKHLKTTGMGIADMVRYARLRAEGPQTAAERSQMLKDQKAKVLAQIESLQETLPVLDKKIAIYRDMEQTHIMEASDDRSTQQIPRVQPASKRP